MEPQASELTKMRQIALKRTKVAKGKKCRDCGTNMFAEREDEQPKGRWVYYKCLNRSCNGAEKVFESR